MRRAAVVVCLLGAACGGSSPATPSVPPTCATETALAVGGSAGLVLSDGTCRIYLVHVPPGYEAARPMPLVLALHGYGGDPASFELTSALSRSADGEGFVVAYPAGISHAWDLGTDGVDARFLRALVAQLELRANIDRRRIYVTGFSMGGAMTNRAACELSDLVAAAAPVSGSLVGYDACPTRRPMPILAIHGLSDNVVPPMGSPTWPALGLWLTAWAARNGCSSSPVVDDRGSVIETAWPGCADGSEVRLLGVPGLGHTWWGQANGELWAFFELHPMPG